jgi:hypothetical protein
MSADNVGNDLFDIGWDCDVKRYSLGPAAGFDDFPPNALRMVTSGACHDDKARRGELTRNSATNAP